LGMFPALFPRHNYAPNFGSQAGQYHVIELG
jgi:hypothetical protein